MKAKPIHTAILQAWASAFGTTKVSYVSGPITTGRAFFERLAGGEEAAAARQAIFESNCAALIEAAELVRARDSVIVVEPATIMVNGWSQADYMALWRELIARHVERVILLPGWEFSAGATEEFVQAIQSGIGIETLAGEAVQARDGDKLIALAQELIVSGAGANLADAQGLLDRLAKSRAALEPYCEPLVIVKSEGLRKDHALDQLADTLNVAQFVSFEPKRGEPKQAHCRIAGIDANKMFASLEESVETLLRYSVDQSVNVRSYDPQSPQSKEFVYGLKRADEAVANIRRLTTEGLHTIVNETIDVGDGGVSGVLMEDVLEFSPDDTPRCVEKPGTAMLPRGWGRKMLETVYGIPLDFIVPRKSRLEFSVHPRPQGWRQTNVLAWEYEEPSNVNPIAAVRWPNRFSRLLGDKVYGLLVAHHIGLAVPRTTVINRRVAPFSFGVPTQSGTRWIRTAPYEQVPGKYTTQQGWMDPYALLAKEDPDGDVLASVIAQDGIGQEYSGALITAADGTLIIEGKRGSGEDFMLGVAKPEHLPKAVLKAVHEVYEYAADILGPVRFEWVFDGNRAWVVQMHAGASVSKDRDITPLSADRWIEFDPAEGLEKLRDKLNDLSPGEGIVLTQTVGITSHFADVLRRAEVPARMVPSAT